MSVATGFSSSPKLALVLLHEKSDRNTENMLSISQEKTPHWNKGKKLVYFDHQNVGKSVISDFHLAIQRNCLTFHLTCLASSSPAPKDAATFLRTDVGTARQKDFSVKDIRTQKFPHTDFFKTLTAGRKW